MPMAPLFQYSGAGAAVRGCFRRNIAIRFGAKKLDWFGYPIKKKSLRIRLLVLTECMNVTDGQTDRHRMTA